MVAWYMIKKSTCRLVIQVYLGQTNLTIDKALLGDSGVRVATVDQSIFMYGSTKFGDLFSVYEFLEQQFDFEIYALMNFILIVV